MSLNSRYFVCRGAYYQHSWLEEVSPLDVRYSSMAPEPRLLVVTMAIVDDIAVGADIVVASEIVAVVDIDAVKGVVEVLFAVRFLRDVTARVQI